MIDPVDPVGVLQHAHDSGTIHHARQQRRPPKLSLKTEVWMLADLSGPEDRDHVAPRCFSGRLA
jgi:hypothetical protein